MLVKKIISNINYLRNYGLASTVRKILRNHGFPHIFLQFSVKANDTVFILSKQHTLFIALLFADYFSTINIKCKIIEEQPKGGFQKGPHIVICPAVFDILPEGRVAFFQLEQYTSDWFSNWYIDLLRSCKTIFDYSIDNIDELIRRGVDATSLYHLPLSPLSKFGGSAKQNQCVNILFYGALNERRKNILTSLIRHGIKINIVTNAYKDELERLLDEAHIVLNLHFYENALLETTRCYEAISHDCLVISESSIDLPRHDEALKIIDFTQVGDIDAIMDTIKKYDIKMVQSKLTKQKTWALQHKEFYIRLNQFLNIDTPKNHL